jgi:uncharacterized damage-inducible protein DinB
MTDTDAATLTGERADLLATLQRRRHFLRFTVQGLSDEQLRLKPTTSALTLGGLLKHVAATEQVWARFITEGPSAFERDAGEGDPQHFTLADSDTLDSLLAAYQAVGAATDELIVALPDLGAEQPLPKAPWFPAGARWSARYVLMHISAETAQHCGHADIIRESIDGQRTMG